MIRYGLIKYKGSSYKTVFTTRSKLIANSLSLILGKSYKSFRLKKINVDNTYVWVKI